MKKAFNLFSASLSKVHWTFFTLAVLCAVAMMAGCKGGAANKNDSDSTMLLGKWECQKIRVESVNRYDSTDVHIEDYAIDSIALEMCEFKSDGTITEYTDKQDSPFKLTWDWSMDECGDTVYLTFTNGRSTPDYNDLYVDHIREILKLDKKQMILRLRSYEFGYYVSKTATYKRQ